MFACAETLIVFAVFTTGEIVTSFHLRLELMVASTLAIMFCTMNQRQPNQTFHITVRKCLSQTWWWWCRTKSAEVWISCICASLEQVPSHCGEKKKIKLPQNLKQVQSSYYLVHVCCKSTHQISLRYISGYTQASSQLGAAKPHQYSYSAFCIFATGTCEIINLHKYHFKTQYCTGVAWLRPAGSRYTSLISGLPAVLWSGSLCDYDKYRNSWEPFEFPHEGL